MSSDCIKTGTPPVEKDSRDSAHQCLGGRGAVVSLRYLGPAGAVRVVAARSTACGACAGCVCGVRCVWRAAAWTVGVLWRRAVVGGAAACVRWWALRSAVACQGAADVAAPVPVGKQVWWSPLAAAGWGSWVSKSNGAQVAEWSSLAPALHHRAQRACRCSNGVRLRLVAAPVPVGKQVWWSPLAAAGWGSWVACTLRFNTADLHSEIQLG